MLAAPRRHACLVAALALPLALGACQFELSVADGGTTADARARDDSGGGGDGIADGPSDSGRDGPGAGDGPSDGPRPDQPTPGDGPADGPRPDRPVTPPDQRVPDQRVPDQAPPPDQRVPDQAPPPDQRVPDQAPPPDQRVPDQGAPHFDLGTVCVGVTKVSGRPSLRARTFATTSWTRLVDLAWRPGDTTRLFVIEQHVGRVRVIQNGTPVSTAALDIGSRVSTASEQGLLAITFHPQHASNRKLYIMYTDTSGANQLREFRLRANNANQIDPASERTILTLAQPRSNHNGGTLRFGPDGYLYISIGDGGGGGDPFGTIGNGQRTDTLLGKILRIDVDRQAGGKNYAVPADNPYVNNSVFAPEIWHWGLRHPFRFTFDSHTGAMWIGDVGQKAWEELDYAAPGAKGLNFGWRCREGLVAFDMSTANCSTATFTDPVLVHPNSNAYCSIFAGHAYRGCKMPGYHGTVFYSDYCYNSPRAFEWNGSTVSNDRAITTITGNPAVAWAEDHQRELYFVTLTNRVFKLEPQ